MSNPNKIRLIKSYNPHGFTGGDTPSPSTVDLYVRSEAGAPLLAASVPVTKQVDERKLLINLKDFDFESSDIIAVVDVVNPCVEYSQELEFGTPPDGAPILKDTVYAPTVTGITPATGDNDLATTITNLAGTNFVDGATVTVGGVAATSVVFVNPTKLTCVVPSGITPAGAADVVVTNPDSQTGTLVDGFTVVID